MYVKIRPEVTGKVEKFENHGLRGYHWYRETCAEGAARPKP